MKSNLVTLLKVQFLNQSTLNAFLHETDKKKKARTVGVGIALVIVFAMLVGYSFLIGYGYGYLGMADAVPGYALAITAIITLFFTFVKTNGFLFAFKDYDMLLSLPFSTETVITSKFLYMYINNLIFGLCVMIPMGIAYGIWMKPAAAVYLIWFIVACFAPLLPMTIAAALGAVIAAIGSRFRFKVFVQAILTMVLVMACMSLSFLLNGSGSNAEFLKRVENIGTVVKAQMHRIYPLTMLFEDAVNDRNLLSAFLFLLLSLVVYLIFVRLVSIKYKAINTALMSGHLSSNYKVGKLQKHSVIQAIVRKEAKKFTSCIAYLMNVGMGMFLAVIGSGICMFIGVDKVLTSMEIGVAGANIRYAIPFIIAVPLTMTCTTCVSWSLEGKNLWILKSLPLEEKTIFQGKMVFNMMLVLPAGAICCLCFLISMKLSIVEFLLYLLVTFAAVSFSTVFGMWANITFPNFEWGNEVEVVKQGVSSMLGIFVNMILEIILTAAMIGLSIVIDGRILMVFFSVMLIGAASGIYYYIISRKTA